MLFAQKLNENTTHLLWLVVSAKKLQFSRSILTQFVWVGPIIVFQSTTANNKSLTMWTSNFYSFHRSPTLPLSHTLFVLFALPLSFIRPFNVCNDIRHFANNANKCLLASIWICSLILGENVRASVLTVHAKRNGTYLHIHCFSLLCLLCSFFTVRVRTFSHIEYSIK